MGSNESFELKGWTGEDEGRELKAGRDMRGAGNEGEHKVKEWRVGLVHDFRL